MTEPFHDPFIVRERATLFLPDPSGNALEFKSFRNPENVFKP